MPSCGYGLALGSRPQVESHCWFIVNTRNFMIMLFLIVCHIDSEACSLSLAALVGSKDSVIFSETVFDDGSLLNCAEFVTTNDGAKLTIFCFVSNFFNQNEVAHPLTNIICKVS